MKNDQPFWFYLAISSLLHLAVFLLFHFGFPSIFKPKPEEHIVTFEILPIDSISNIKTQKIQKEKQIDEEKAKKVQKSKAKEEEAAETNIKEEQEAKEESKRDPEEKKPQDNKDIVHIKDKKQDKKTEKNKSNKAQTKQDKNAPKKPKPKKKIPNEKDIDMLLKTLEKASEGTEEKASKRAVSEKSDAIEEAIGNFNEDLPLSISEKAAIKQQIQDKWNVPIGVQSAGEIVITLYIAIKIDGTIEQVKVVDTRCPVGANIVCNAARDSAVRAVWLASPLQNLPAERYNVWKAFNIEFDPRDALGM